MLADPRFEAIWLVIKSWDINVPGAYGGYRGATGNHVRAILDALPAPDHAALIADLEAGLGSEYVGYSGPVAALLKRAIAALRGEGK
jgi:hypothetical protein